MDSLEVGGPAQIPINLPSSVFLPHRSYLGWKIVVTLFQLLSTSSTVYRLVHRYRIRRLWWDDYILLGALVLDSAYWPICWARFPNPEHPSKGFVKTQRILGAYWFTMFPFILLLGSTRAVMALSLARIFPPRHAARRWAFSLVVFMVFGGLASLLFTTLTCKARSALLVVSEMRDCITVYNGVPLKHLLFFLVDLMSDSLLIITPLVIFWRIKLPPTERRLILTFFCGSVLTLLGSVAYLSIANSGTVLSLGTDRPLVNLGLGAIEVSMSFMACNLVVISTCFYRALRKYRNRPRTPVVQNPNPNPVAPAPEPPVSECSCMTSDHITPLTLTEISTIYTRPNTDSSRRNSDTNDMLDSIHSSDIQDSTAGSSRKSTASSWSYPTTSSKSQKSKRSIADLDALEDHDDSDYTTTEPHSHELDSIKQQSTSTNSTKEQSTSTRTDSTEKQPSSTDSTQDPSSNGTTSQSSSTSS